MVLACAVFLKDPIVTYTHVRTPAKITELSKEYHTFIKFAGPQPRGEGCAKWYTITLSVFP